MWHQDKADVGDEVSSKVMLLGAVSADTICFDACTTVSHRRVTSSSCWMLHQAEPNRGSCKQQQLLSGRDTKRKADLLDEMNTLSSCTR